MVIFQDQLLPQCPFPFTNAPATSICLPHTSLLLQESGFVFILSFCTMVYNIVVDMVSYITLYHPPVNITPYSCLRSSLHHSFCPVFVLSWSIQQWHVFYWIPVLMYFVSIIFGHSLFYHYVSFYPEHEVDNFVLVSLLSSFRIILSRSLI